MAAITTLPIEHYDVEAATLADVVALLSGRDEAGHCSWEIGYGYDGVDRDGRPTGLRLTVRIRIEMPRWVGRDSATAAEKTEWDRFHQALLAHERGHESRTRNAIPATERRMRRSLVADLGTVHGEEITRIQGISDAFDTATDHGRTPAPGTIITIPAASGTED